MIIKGLIFDINGTVTEINTNEWHDEIYRILSNVLLYQGISLNEQKVRDVYNRLLKSQREAGGEQHPEFNATGIFQEIIDQHATAYTLNLPEAKLEQLPFFLAETFRAASLFSFETLPGSDRYDQGAASTVSVRSPLGRANCLGGPGAAGSWSV